VIWQNPWAWLGAMGIALPILIHLLGRGHANVLRFPTLRFIEVSRLLPTKRSRIQDPWLLVVRVATVACAALALTQPLLLTGARRQTFDRGLGRAVIVDTSASIRRFVIDSARAIARELAAQAQSSIIVESDDPSREIAGAAAWVARQQRRGEIAIVSDFQRGQLDREDLAAVPAPIGIVLRKVGAARRNDSSRVRMIADGRTRTASAMVTPTGVGVAWGAAVDSAPAVPVILRAGRDDDAGLVALQSAAATMAVPLPIDTARAIAIVFARSPSRDSLIGGLGPARLAWELGLLADARAAGLPVSASGEGVVDGRTRFVIATSAEPLALDAARLVALARRATSAAPSVSELEPGIVPDSELQTWERAAVTSGATQYRPSDANGPSDGRWLWAVVLALVAMEWRMRRRATSATSATVERARAA
jgi:hypothetical protein